MEKLSAGAEKLGIALSQEQLGQFSRYYQELLTWNRRMNLTAITDYEEVQIKHFLDALTVTLACQDELSRAGTRVIDIGSGAGIPGLPLKIVFPDIQLVLLEATAKKASFLRHLTDKLQLANVEIVTGRAETMAHQSDYREKFDSVLSRALAPLPTLVELTLPFCAIGGCLIAQQKGNITPEIDRATRVITILGGNLREVKSIDLPEFNDQRRLLIIDKLVATPEQYPRRPGIPRKRPLT